VIKVEGRFIDRFKGRVIFPLFDHRGNCVGLAGRIMPKDETTGRAKYINSPETLVYHKGSLLYGLHLTRSDIKREGFAIVVEGEFDTILPWQAGIKNTVAIKGSALTADHVKVLSRITGFLVLALDRDLAGDTAARKGINIAQDAGLDVKVATFSGFKDPAEASKSGPSVFKKSISQAQDIWDYLIDSVISRYDKNSGEGKAKISREIVPILSSINDKIVESHYLKKLAQKLGVQEEAVYAEAEKFSRKQQPETLEVFKPKKESKGRRQILEERFLELAFQGNLSILENTKYLSKIKTPLALRILKEYEVYKQTNKSFDASLFAQNLPKELLEGFAQMILKGSQEDLDHPERIQKEIKLINKELSLWGVKEKLEKLKNLISELEKSGKSHELAKAKEEFAKLSRKRSSLEEG
ncbi:MAG: toprim domain-containing protein, partial [Patescibacteria group bacterium]